MTTITEQAAWGALAAANPVTDAESLRPDLPVLETLLAPQPRHPRDGLPRRSLASAGLALAAVVAVVLLMPSGDDRSRVRLGPLELTRAVASNLESDGQILHVVQRMTGEGTAVTTDVWLAPDGRSGRVRSTTADGRVLADEELLARPGRPGTFDPLAAARAALRNGELVPVRQVERDGRRLEVFENEANTTTWYFDAETFDPVRVEQAGTADGRLPVTTVFEPLERLDDTDANRRLLTAEEPIAGRPDAATPGTGAVAP